MPANQSCRYDFISTDGLPPAQQFAFWRDSCLKRFEPLGSASTQHDQFGASVRRLGQPAGRLTDLRVKPTGIRRTARLCRADEVDDIVVGIEFGGGARRWIGDPDRTVELASSKMRLFDYYNQPSVMQWYDTDHRALHIDLPDAVFDARTLGGILFDMFVDLTLDTNPPVSIAPALAQPAYSVA